MKLISYVLAAALLLASPAFAAEDPAHYLLSSALIDKLKAAEADMKALNKPGEAAPAPAPAADDGDKSLEAAIRKVDQDPQMVAVLAKHGLTSRDLVLSAHALLHAGVYVALEKTLDKKKIPDPYRDYTTEQKVNIAVVRAYATGKKQ